MSEDAELQILRAAQTTLAGISKQVSKGVDLGRSVPIGEPTDLPRLFLAYGDDDIVEDGLSSSDNQMELIVGALVRDLDEYGIVQMAALRSAVHAAFMADRTLGLPEIVIDIAPLGAARPQRLEADRASMPPVFREFSFQIRYRTNAGDRTQGGTGAPT